MVNKQRGFTLVEIAIVLVIIGLLLGGILKGQELITAARVRNFADQAAGSKPLTTGLSTATEPCRGTCWEPRPALPSAILLRHGAVRAASAVMGMERSILGLG